MEQNIKPIQPQDNDHEKPSEPEGENEQKNDSQNPEPTVTELLNNLKKNNPEAFENFP